MESRESLWARRKRQASETVALLGEMHKPPSREEVIRLHMLHAQHERESGRPEKADRAEQRAANERNRCH